MGFLKSLISLVITGINLLLSYTPLLIAYVAKNPNTIQKIVLSGIAFLNQLREERQRLTRQNTITLLGAKNMDLYDYQREMENLFSNNQLHKRVKEEFENEPLFLAHMNEVGIDPDFGYDLLVQIYLHKRANVPTLVGLLRKHFDGNVQDTADALYHATDNDLVDWDDLSQTFVVRYGIPQEVQDIIDTYQYPLPMIVRPKKIRHNYESGYLNHKCSIILKNNHHEDDVCLEFINKINSIKLRINHDTANMVHNKWKNLDKPKEGESFEKYKQRQRQFDKYNRTAHDVLQHIAVAGNEFYLTHRYDKRGRVYCQGYHVTYQGTSWNKAVVEFADGELVDGF